MIVIVSVVLIKRKNITVLTNGKKIEFVTYKGNVKDALAANQIKLDKKDKTIPPLDAPIKNHQSIILKKAVNIEVDVDGKKLQLKSAEDNIALMLKAEKIAMSNVDKISPSTTTILKNGLKVNITRVDSKTYKKLVQLDYKVITKVNPSLPNTINKIVQEGSKGEKELTYQIIYHNGKVFSKKIIKQVVLKKTVDKLIVLGGYPSKPISPDGKMLSYSKKFVARATAYWAVRGVGRTFTGSGRRAIRNSRGYSTVAVDRKLYPYGTKLFIEGYGFAIAADTGTAIKGNTIDVFFNTRKEACNWAVKHPTVYVLK